MSLSRPEMSTGNQPFTRLPFFSLPSICPSESSLISTPEAKKNFLPGSLWEKCVGFSPLLPPTPHLHWQGQTSWQGPGAVRARVHLPEQRKLSKPPFLCSCNMFQVPFTSAVTSPCQPVNAETARAPVHFTQGPGCSLSLCSTLILNPHPQPPERRGLRFFSYPVPQHSATLRLHGC